MTKNSLRPAGGATCDKYHKKGTFAMSRKKKKGKQDALVTAAVLLAAILDLVRAIIDLIDRLTG